MTKGVAMVSEFAVSAEEMRLFRQIMPKVLSGILTEEVVVYILEVRIAGCYTLSLPSAHRRPHSFFVGVAQALRDRFGVAMIPQLDGGVVTLIHFVRSSHR